MEGSVVLGLLLVVSIATAPLWLAPAAAGVGLAAPASAVGPCTVDENPSGVDEYRCPLVGTDGGYLSVRHGEYDADGTHHETTVVAVYTGRDTLPNGWGGYYGHVTRDCASSEGYEACDLYVTPIVTTVAECHSEEYGPAAYSWRECRIWSLHCGELHDPSQGWRQHCTTGTNPGLACIRTSAPDASESLSCGVGVHLSVDVNGLRRTVNVLVVGGCTVDDASDGVVTELYCSATPHVGGDPVFVVECAVHPPPSEVPCLLCPCWVRPPG